MINAMNDQVTTVYLRPWLPLDFQLYCNSSNSF